MGGVAGKEMHEDEERLENYMKEERERKGKGWKRCRGKILCGLSEKREARERMGEKR